MFLRSSRNLNKQTAALALLLYRSKAALILRYILKLVRKDRSFLATFEDPATTHSGTIL